MTKVIEVTPEPIVKTKEEASVSKTFKSNIDVLEEKNEKREVPKIKKRESNLIWENISSQQIANWIIEKYKGFHFSTEMLVRFLEEEQGTFPNYFSSEELKTNPKLNEADDLKAFLFSAIGEQTSNPFIKIEQLFYDGDKENIQLNITQEDYELIKDRTKEERSGIYFKIIE